MAYPEVGFRASKLERSSNNSFNPKPLFGAALAQPEAPALKLAQTILSIFALLPATAFAQGIQAEARKQFDECMMETKVDREQCSFGGCGNIIGTCYDRQLGTISASIELLTKQLSAGQCAQSAASAATEIDTLDSRLKLLPPLDNTWGGYEIQVEMALLKHEVMTTMAKECQAPR